MKSNVTRSPLILVAFVLSILFCCVTSGLALAGVVAPTRHHASSTTGEDAYNATSGRKLLSVAARSNPFSPPEGHRRRLPPPKFPRSPPPPASSPLPPFPPVGPPSEYHSLHSDKWADVIVSTNGSVIFAHNVTDLFWSQDGGQLWRYIPPPTTYIPRPMASGYWDSLTVSKSSMTLFFSYNEALYTSNDYGVTWANTSSIPCFKSPPVAASNTYEEKYLSTSDDGETIGAHYRYTRMSAGVKVLLKERVCVSRDAGATWKECSSCSYNNANGTIIIKPLSVPDHTASDTGISISGDGSVLVYSSPAKGGGAVVSTSTLELVPLNVTLWPISLSYNGSLFGQFNNTLFLSTDRGATLKNLTLEAGAPLSPFFGYWYSLFISADGTRLVARATIPSDKTKAYYSESSDSGLSWTASDIAARNELFIPTTAGTSSLGTIWAIPAYDNIYNSAVSRLVKSTDHGKTFGELFTATTIKVSPDGQTVMSGNWLSRDGGSSWSKLSGGKDGVAMCAGGRGLIATYNSTLYMSRNGGLTWKSLAYIDGVKRVVASQKDCKRIFVVSSPNITHISKNWGKTWSSKVANFYTFRTYFTMSASWDLKKIVVSTGTMDVSIDGGNTWTPRGPFLPEGVNYTDIHIAALYPLYSGDGKRQLVGITYDLPYANLMISDDDFATWHKVGANSYDGWPIPYWPPTVQDELAASYDGKIMYGVEPGHFMRSNTGGLTWQFIDFLGPYISAVGTSQDGRIVYILEIHGGIYASQDYGTTWNFTGPGVV
jgi:photosystem II stability/assembly factor-like uncharacterized protein